MTWRCLIFFPLSFQDIESKKKKKNQTQSCWQGDTPRTTCSELERVFGWSPADPITDISARSPRDASSDWNRGLFHLNPAALGMCPAGGSRRIPQAPSQQQGKVWGHREEWWAQIRLSEVEELSVTGRQCFHSSWGARSHSSQNHHHWLCFTAAQIRPDRADPELESCCALSRCAISFLDQRVSALSQSLSFLPLIIYFFFKFFHSFLPLINHSSGPARPINYSSLLDLSEMQLQMQFNLLTHDR